jgi:hypothetical protein
MAGGPGGRVPGGVVSLSTEVLRRVEGPGAWTNAYALLVWFSSCFWACKIIEAVGGGGSSVGGRAMRLEAGCLSS